MTIDTDKLPRDVVELVVAGREAWQLLENVMWPCPETDALNRALEAFSARVPYENEPSK